MSIYRLPFGDDPDWTGGANWDDPAGGHPASQAYAFDLGHATGGEVRAAREGFVVAAIGDRHCNTWQVQPGDPCFGLPADHGQGNLVLIRHPDDTVAAYAHLKKGKVFVENGKWVPQGMVIAQSDHTGNSSAPHLHFEVRAFRLSDTDANAGPTIPVQFEDKKHLAWRPRGGDKFFSNNTAFRQEGWRWCHKCQGLFYGGKPLAGTVGGACKAGGSHEAVGSANYILVLNSTAPGEKGWRWCKKCQGLFFGAGSASKCPADGGAHVKTGSGNYVLVKDAPGGATQAGWRRCKKCQGLFFGENSGSQCPAGGSHSKAGSGNYSLAEMGPGEIQANWRWCNKCQGLFFNGNPGSHCPVGGAHDGAGSWNYVLVRDYVSGTVPGQKNWRWCWKCQGLFFGGNPGSRCPVGPGQAHKNEGSGNYVLVQDKPGAPGQNNWRQCHKCQGLFFAGNPTSKCPAGGAHSKTGSGDYSLLS